jgi:DNA modification methylase
MTDGVDMPAVLVGDAVTVLRTLPADSVQCVVTSPPYFGLRDYGVAGQIGLEETPEAYVARLVEVFAEAKRVLRPDGTLWLNLGDSYAGGGGGNYGFGKNVVSQGGQQVTNVRNRPAWLFAAGVKPKDLLGIPWRVAFALQADGWYLRSAIVWHKPNPMPESVTSRPTTAYEHVFLLAKSPSYFYDAVAIAEDAVGRNHHDLTGGRYKPPGQASHSSSRANAARPIDGKRSARNVWTITAKPFKGAHFAVMPVDLAERCILAGTVPLVARRLGRRGQMIELNPTYAEMARERLDGPLFATAAE